eukprot:TRINITY_DN12542_c2_g1_i1.p1 TRINITY_DN12542_c2_g1~~TRINITY_DN12542_c2_g1_i1.p1  ORF type:complete len:884 (+),score=136.78 TRINITY_DN12542_c2_g1_i1:126-2777(+)
MKIHMKTLYTRLLLGLGVFLIGFFAMHNKLSELPGGNNHAVDMHGTIAGQREDDDDDSKITRHETKHPIVEKVHQAEAKPEKIAIISTETEKPKPRPHDGEKEPSGPAKPIWEHTTKKNHLTIIHYGNSIYHIQVRESGSDDAHANRAHCSRWPEVIVADEVPVPQEVYKRDIIINEEGDKVTISLPTHNLEVSFESNGKSIVVDHQNTKYLTGLPERTSGVVLTDGSYELMNLDANHYRLDSKDALYGIVPIVMSQKSGFLNLNPSRTTVKVHGTTTTWDSIQNCRQFVIYPGGDNSQSDVLRQHSFVTGKPFLPPIFSIGYHQCRWNYVDQEDVLTVSNKLAEHKMPCDAIWLDIEHTDRKHYFTWDHHKFSEPVEMQNKLRDSYSRKLVTISDPHISRSPDYFVFKEAQEKNYFVKKANSKTDYDGHCWPGGSSWIDFLNPEARTWYADIFKFDRYKGSTENTYTWIDMNEPSVFSGPRTTMHDEAMHIGGVRHDQVHNIYGHLQSMAAYKGLLERNPEAKPGSEKRPFILSRSFFAGTQRYAAIWTGDNQAKWSHMAASVHMVLGMGLGGIPFVGADVGGFFDNPSPKLFARWYQLGCLYPFFRSHSEITTTRREPYLMHTPYEEIIQSSLYRRYSLIPYFYTQFFNASVEGLPIWRPLFLIYEDEDPTRIDSFMVGDSLLFSPIVQESVETHEVTLPGSLPWYDFETGESFAPAEKHEIPVTLKTSPLFQASGSIIATKVGVETITSTVPLKKLPYQLKVAVNTESNCARGKLFLDDEETMAYKEGKYNYKMITLENDVLKLVCAHSQETKSVFSVIPPSDVPYTPDTAPIESILVFGWSKEFSSSLSVESVGNGGHLISGLSLSVTEEWTLDLVGKE